MPFTKEQMVTTEELKRLIKTQPRGTEFYVYATADGGEKIEFSKACGLCVPVSKKLALELAGRALKPHREANGSRIPCSVYEAGEHRSFYIF